MIHYKTDGIHPFLNLFRCRGSAVVGAIKFSVPCASVAAFIKWTMLQNWWSQPEVLSNNAVWTGFTFLVGFLVIFRTSQGYARFLEGSSLTHKMRAEWFDSCAGILAFTIHSTSVSADELFKFRSLIIRLFSILHATALATIEDTTSHNITDIQAFNYELLDAESIDKTTLDAIRTSSTRPELIYYWINQLVVDGTASGILSVPPPILSRCFQTIANGMVAFHEAVRLSSIPFPFPYAQACDWLLLFHLVCAPFVTAQWSLEIPTTFVFAFIQVCTLWTLNGIAQELENPFGTDPNDLDCQEQQREMNRFLEMLVEPASLRLPVLVDAESQNTVQHTSTAKRRNVTRRLSTERASFLKIWGTKGESEIDAPADISLEIGGSLECIGRKSADMVRSMAAAITHLKSDDERSETPRETSTKKTSKPALRIASSSERAGLERKHDTNDHDMPEEAQHPRTASSSSIGTCHNATGELHVQPDRHSQSNLVAPPDSRAFVYL